jgi:hypothetical protein
MCARRTVLQVKIRITGDTVLNKSHIYIFSQRHGGSNHEPSQGNALAVHEVAKEKKKKRKLASELKT